MRVLSERSRYGILQSVVGQYASSIDRREIIGNFIECLEKELLPVDVYVYGSNSLLLGLPMKDLFLTGVLDVRRQVLLNRESVVDNGVSFFPIVGFEGVYGLIEVGDVMSDSDMKLLSDLTKLIGQMVEEMHRKDINGNLLYRFHEMNRVWIRLNELGSVESITSYLDECMKALFGAREVRIFVSIRDFLEARNSSYGNRKTDSPVLKDWIGEVSKKRVPVIKDDLNKWDTRKLGDLIGFDSGICIPFVRDFKIVGYCLVLFDDANSFIYEYAALMNTVIHYASLVYYNVMLLGQLREKVYLDLLTKLYTRDYLMDEIDLSYDRDECGSFLIFDIDNFKQINDSLGHSVGDQILIQVADVLKEGVREGDTVCRWGGEELVVYLPNTSIDFAVRVADRLVRSIEKHTNPVVTVSCGLSSWYRDGALGVRSYDRLFKNADDALYVAKSTGKNRAEVGRLD